MRKIFLTIIFGLLFFPQITFGVEAKITPTLTDRLAGRILLQVESFGRAWYVDPVTKTRCYLRDGAEAYQIMRKLSLGITNHDLAKIPAKTGEEFDQKLVDRLRGRILLAVENRGEAWYLNPVDGLRYYLTNGEAAYQLMRKSSLGITNQNLAKIPVSDWQVAADYAFAGPAYTSYDGENFSGDYFSDTILPPASMTKLMTALVLLDLNLDWQKTAVVTAEEINYPKTYVGNDPTSEIDLDVGDEVKLDDLWAALLIASSNQSAAILADASGYSRAAFVDLMNEKAAALGLTKTHFVDVSGLDANNVTTPKDMAIIARTAFSTVKVAATSVKTNYIINVKNKDKTISVVNRNYSLLKFIPDGVKTGYLVEAGCNAALQKGDKTIVVMHAKNLTERNQIVGKLLGN